MARLPVRAARPASRPRRLPRRPGRGRAGRTGRTPLDYGDSEYATGLAAELEARQEEAVAGFQGNNPCEAFHRLQELNRMIGRMSAEEVRRLRAQGEAAEEEGRRACSEDLLDDSPFQEAGTGSRPQARGRNRRRGAWGMPESGRAARPSGGYTKSAPDIHEKDTMGKVPPARPAGERAESRRGSSARFREVAGKSQLGPGVRLVAASLLPATARLFPSVPAGGAAAIRDAGVAASRRKNVPS